MAPATPTPHNASNHQEGRGIAVYGPWDRFIRAMRLILPLCAALLGATTILWPFLNDQEVSFNLSTDDVAKGDNGVHMTNIKYVGTDAINRLFRVKAASGLQENPTAPRIRLTDIQAEMSLDEAAGLATVDARTGIYRMSEGTLSLVGGVHMISGNGYTLEMAGAEVDLKAHTATGQGAIRGRAKLGTLEAARVEIHADTEEAVFDGGIKLHIEPHRPVSDGASK